MTNKFMLPEKTLFVTETGLYAEFDPIIRFLLKRWKKSIIKIGNNDDTWDKLTTLNHQLQSENVVVFFDHHYAFDAFPVTLALGQTLTKVACALVPYAVHLDMSVDPDGYPALRYRIRTRIFRHMINSIQKANPNIHVLPVVREFELGNPRLRAIADNDFSGANTKYLKTFLRLFNQSPAGLACILSPMGGIAFPDKPVLSSKIYRSVEMVQSKGRQLPFYFVSAYPKLRAYYHYFAPLLTQHTFVVQGPFSLPNKNFDEATAIVTEQLQQLRQTGGFIQPDYSRIEHK